MHIVSESNLEKVWQHGDHFWREDLATGQWTGLDAPPEHGGGQPPSFAELLLSAEEMYERAAIMVDQSGRWLKRKRRASFIYGFGAAALLNIAVQVGVDLAQ